MTKTEALLYEMLKATTIALRVMVGHVEPQYTSTARAMATQVVADADYRTLTGAQRAALADADAAIVAAAGAAKGLKS